jgi:hypothetical protein
VACRPRPSQTSSTSAPGAKGVAPYGFGGGSGPDPDVEGVDDQYALVVTQDVQRAPMTVEHDNGRGNRAQR